MFYVSNASIVNNASNYLHDLHDFIQVMQVITHIIWNFEYFKSKNSAMRVMQGGFESNIRAMRVMLVFELRRGIPRLARPCYVSIFEYLNILKFFLIFDQA